MGYAWFKYNRRVYIYIYILYSLVHNEGIDKLTNKPDGRAKFKAELQHIGEHDTPSRSLQKLSSNFVFHFWSRQWLFNKRHNPPPPHSSSSSHAISQGSPLTEEASHITSSLAYEVWDFITFAWKCFGCSLWQQPDINHLTRTASSDENLVVMRRESST
ncbi:hypothetical protein Bca101_087422 [Brassica carinata]